MSHGIFTQIKKASDYIFITGFFNLLILWQSLL